MTNTATHHEAVGAYASLEGAERAVAHLVSCGYDEEDVAIGPRDYEPVDPNGFARLAVRWLGRGVAVGAGAMAAIAVAREISWDAVEQAVVPFLLWGAAAGGFVGLVVAFVLHRIAAAHTYFSEPAELEPQRFEVVAERDPKRARNDLARWWDPAAPSAGLDPSA